MVSVSNGHEEQPAMSEDRVRARLNELLVKSGEKERLMELLRTRLIECGWRDEMKQFCKRKLLCFLLPSVLVAIYFNAHLYSILVFVVLSQCTEIIKRKSLDKITVEELVSEAVPRGRGMLCFIHPCSVFCVLENVLFV
jgi:enhancer of yellow 2 transcription factor